MIEEYIYKDQSQSWVPQCSTDRKSLNILKKENCGNKISHKGSNMKSQGKVLQRGDFNPTF